jgi:membrane-associated phospholipid phosphatase
MLYAKTFTRKMPVFSRIKYGISAILLFCLFSLSAQSPYRFSVKREAAWMGGSGAGVGLSLWLATYNKPLTQQQIAALDVNTVPRFDRYSLRHFSGSAKKASDVLLLSSPVLPLLLSLDPTIRRQTPQYGWLVAESGLTALALTNIVKHTARRTRPFAYRADVPPGLATERDARESFFSGHTSMTAAMSFSAAAIWQEHHRDSRWAPLVWAGAVALPVTTGFLRMRAGKHFPTDVLAGFAVGALCGWGIPRLHRI